MRLPLYCGKHHGFYPAALAEETLRTGKHYVFLSGTDFSTCGPRKPRAERWCRIASSLLVAKLIDQQRPDQRTRGEHRDRYLHFRRLFQP
jgi:hypothetical protein